MRERWECKMQNFISFLMVLIFFENFEKFSKGVFDHLSKMSLQGTIVPGRLCSELCPWGVNFKPFPKVLVGSLRFMSVSANQIMDVILTWLGMT